MHVLALQAAGAGGSQIETLARTFGVDWPHLSRRSSASGSSAPCCTASPIKPVLQMLETRRQQIASGLANAERIDAELARIESERQAVLAEADAEGKRLIEEARAAAARVEAEETQRAIGRRRADPRQGARGRRARARTDARRAQARGRPPGRADDRGGHRQDPDAGRSPAARGRNRQPAGIEP